MGLKKRRPCGAVADVNELEYISALHQTGKDSLREDGTIEASDIVAFLMSRHGIKVTEEEVKDKVIGTFGAYADMAGVAESRNGNEDTFIDQPNLPSGSGYLDLMQVLALLHIPLLLKAKQSIDQIENESIKLRRHSSGTCLHRHKGDKRWPDADIIEYVLRLMMKDATGGTTPQPLTKELISQMLRFYGEVDASNNVQLLEKMLLAATPEDSKADIEGKPVLLDQYSLAQALTSDVQRYDIDFENSLTTNFHDVFPGDPRGNMKSGHSIETVRTLSCIDYTADTFRSKSFVVVLWVAWVLTYFSYLANDSIKTKVKLQCDDMGFWCTLAQGIINWLVIMFQLSILGSIFTISASVGNARHTHPYVEVLLNAVAIGAISIFIVVPFFVEVQAEVFSTMKDPDGMSHVLYHLSVICGFILLVEPVMSIFQRLLPENSSIRAFLQKHTDNTRLEAAIKLSASSKLNRLVRNARDVHRVAEMNGGDGQKLETRFGNAVVAFTKLSDQKEDIDGFMQTFKRIWSRELYEDDGIWLTTHVLSGNLAQVTVCVLLATLFTILYQSELFQDGVEYLDKVAPGYSQRWRLIVPLFFGFVCGELTILSIISKYIPSYTNTVIQFRSGGLESLRSNSFLKLRYAVDNSSLLFAAIFWGTFYTSIMIGFFFAVLLGVILWPDFAQLVGIVFANIIGIILTVALRWAVLWCFRRVNHKGYYRRSVLFSNFVNIILESWNLALGLGFMIVRGLKFLLAATIFIGRVDVPFLSQDACFVGPVELDNYPLTFRKDILAHEAHRHPYIERIGVMYMLKLRYDDFGSRAGTYWRLLFIHALMPWMRKYRRQDDLALSGFKFATDRIWTGRMPADVERRGEGSEEASQQVAVAGVPSELEMLRAENHDLRLLLFGHVHGSRSHVTTSCPPASSGSKVSTAGLVQSTNTV